MHFISGVVDSQVSTCAILAHRLICKNLFSFYRIARKNGTCFWRVCSFQHLQISISRQTLVPFSKVKGTKLQLKLVVNSTKMSKTKVRSKADTTCNMEIFPCMNEICLSHSCSHLQLHECHASCLMLDRLFQLGYPLFWHFPCRFEALIYMERKFFFFFSHIFE